MCLSYSPEEIGVMHDRNENFQGTQANFEKLQLYQDVKRGLMEFKEHYECVWNAGEYTPNTREKHAVLWIDLCHCAYLNREEIAVLTEIMGKADGVVFTAIGACVRISFAVKNIWDDEI